MKKILPFFSYVFHPMFISLYGTIFYLWASYKFSSNVYYPYPIVVQVILLTVLLPLTLYFLLFTLGFVKSFTEATIKERRIPILIQAVLLFVLLKYNTSLQKTPELCYFFLGGFYSSVLALFSIILRHKSSLHMMGISALTTFMYFICLENHLPLINIICVSIVCMGLVGTSRLYMKSHTIFELITGTIIGVLPQLFIWKLYL